MEIADVLRRQFNDVVPVLGDEPLQTVTDSDDRRHMVVVVGIHDNGADDIVDAWAESAAGDDGALHL